jgi:hypothetical protein
MLIKYGEYQLRGLLLEFECGIAEGGQAQHLV